MLNITVQMAAEALQINRHTLLGRLYRQGTSFRRVVDQIRFSHARRLLGDPTQRVMDVAFDLQFADATGFIRAFRRWTGGRTPQCWRGRGKYRR
jgi:AraC-like DNA-binding protein